MRCVPEPDTGWDEGGRLPAVGGGDAPRGRKALVAGEATLSARRAGEHAQRVDLVAVRREESLAQQELNLLGIREKDTFRELISASLHLSERKTP